MNIYIRWSPTFTVDGLRTLDERRAEWLAVEGNTPESFPLKATELVPKVANAIHDLLSERSKFEISKVTIPNTLEYRSWSNPWLDPPIESFFNGKGSVTFSYSIPPVDKSMLD